MASRPEVARIAACREVDRIPVRGEVAGIAGRRNLIRKWDQQGASSAIAQPPLLGLRNRIKGIALQAIRIIGR
jgi:hypothetical protein